MILCQHNPRRGQEQISVSAESRKATDFILTLICCDQISDTSLAVTTGMLPSGMHHRQALICCQLYTASKCHMHHLLGSFFSRKAVTCQIPLFETNFKVRFLNLDISKLYYTVKTVKSPGPEATLPSFPWKHSKTLFSS